MSTAALEAATASARRPLEILGRWRLRSAPRALAAACCAACALCAGERSHGADPPTDPGAKERAEAREEAPTMEVAAVDILVQGRSVPSSRGASDFRIDVAALRAVPRASAIELLELAPSIFLSKEGGEGHPERIYLRGFDAREGQDVEISVGGVPVNESGHLHGNGFADVAFVIPELVTSLRVLEGPFDPRQGNYAVAGSAELELGLKRRGLTARYTHGSFGTNRALLLWGPREASQHTFGGVELYGTGGFGQNRDARRASAMGQYEGRIGDKGSYRISAAAHASEYHSAGLLREDDLRAGRKGFFDTYDFNQGGGGSRFQIAGDIEARSGETIFSQHIFAVRRGSRLRENFTGFILDTQEPIQTPHGQRSDLLDLEMTATTIGARGSARLRAEVMEQRQELELGYFARGDDVEALRQRVDAAAGVPYETDADLRSKLADIGMYVDATLRPTRLIALRGGVRADLFAFDVLDACAVQSVSRPSKADPPGDESCLDQQRFGAHREPTERSSTAAIKVMPRASLLVGPLQGFTLSLSYGEGARSIDPSYITQDIATPFAGIRAYDGGASYAGGVGDVSLSARSIIFATHVDRDLVFSETEGRSILGGGTTRAGWTGAIRATGDFFDEAFHITLVRSTFDDTGLLVPYSPDVVLRSDTSLFHDLPFTVFGRRPRGTIGAGVSYVGRRALPYGQRSDTIFLIDASATVEYEAYEVGVSVTNALDARYRQAELNYVSDFQSAPAPTLVPARHFAAGAPRAVYLTLAATFGGE